ncbi:MAG: YgiQ family radical SAM protein [Methanolinea sp.]|jgi:uncharacterized radical SAM protein YgiQ|nr:YgiQ family radical SAM protein [Methanolinea sp.]
MKRRQPKFLPMSEREARTLHIDQFDIILVSGDAYVDHPSFSAAVIGRVLWDAGFSVGVIAQPDWRGKDDFLRLGTPRLFFAVCPGNCDSMVDNYTAARKKRSNDVYSPGGVPRRPDRAATVYSDKLHGLYPGVPLILGGIEASLRRFAHYDYWSDKVRHSILADAPADLLVYGMGEQQVREIARRMGGGESTDSLTDIRGTVYRVPPSVYDGTARFPLIEIPSFTEVEKDKEAYARAFAMHYREQNPVEGRAVAQRHPKTIIIQNPPSPPLSQDALDATYELPYTREAHPAYQVPVPALEPVRFSLTSHRGCFGGCSFCALTHHQGRIIQSRSIESLVREATRLTGMKGFKGVISDVGGPTANMYGMECPRWALAGPCQDKCCSSECPSLAVSHTRQIALLRRLREVPGVRRVFIGSGVRYDLLVADPENPLPEICAFHVSGHLKVAPEHISPTVTNLMGKPGREIFERFLAAFRECQGGKEKRQYLLPYFMSGHPGCTVADMIALAEFIRDQRLYTEQVQDFTPTPMTVSTCMYFTGLNPFTLEPVHIPKGREKQIQRALLQYRDPKARHLVEAGLLAAGREDLIGDGNGCLLCKGPERKPG